MIYTFVGIGEDGSVRVLDGWQDLPDNYGKDGFGRFNKLRERNPNTKTLIAIGGWNEGSAKYSAVVANPAIRAKFVQNVVKFVQQYKFDGFDVDWEYPNQRGGKSEDKKNYISLLEELRAEFDKHDLILSAAVAAAEPSASQSYDVAAMSKALHFVNIMSYDLHGAWEKTTGHNAPLYSRRGESGSDLKLNVVRIALLPLFSLFIKRLSNVKRSGYIRRYFARAREFVQSAANFSSLFSFSSPPRRTRPYIIGWTMAARPRN